MPDLPYTHISSLLTYAESGKHLCLLVAQQLRKKPDLQRALQSKLQFHSPKKSDSRGKQKDVAVFQPRPELPSLLKKGRFIDNGNKTSLGKLLLLTLIFPERRRSASGCADRRCDFGRSLTSPRFSGKKR